MTRSQHEATRARREGEATFLEAYGWKRAGAVLGVDDAARGLSNRWAHPNAPKSHDNYSQRDALTLTDAEPLRYGAVR